MSANSRAQRVNALIEKQAVERDRHEARLKEARENLLREQREALAAFDAQQTKQRTMADHHWKQELSSLLSDTCPLRLALEELQPMVSAHLKTIESAQETEQDADIEIKLVRAQLICTGRALRRSISETLSRLSNESDLSVRIAEAQSFLSQQ